MIDTQVQSDVNISSVKFLCLVGQVIKKEKVSHSSCSETLGTFAVVGMLVGTQLQNFGGVKKLTSQTLSQQNKMTKAGVNICNFFQNVFAFPLKKHSGIDTYICLTMSNQLLQLALFLLMTCPPGERKSIAIAKITL